VKKEKKKKKENMYVKSKLTSHGKIKEILMAATGATTY